MNQILKGWPGCDDPVDQEGVDGSWSGLRSPEQPPHPNPLPCTAVASEEAIRNIPSGDHIHIAKQEAVDNLVQTDTSDSIEVEDGLVRAEEDLQGGHKASSATGSDRQMSFTEESREMALGRLHQDLLVYAMGEKYGIPDLKSKAAHHFDKQLQQIEITTDLFVIIQEVYSTTPSQDRGLRDIVVARVYGEIQFWVKEVQFMTTMSCGGDFCADLLAYTVEEDRKQYEAALASIEHPGYCHQCQATLILKRWLSKKRNVQVIKYCARCEPWR